MNVERCEILAAWLEAGGDKRLTPIGEIEFNMGSFYEPQAAHNDNLAHCGTTCCIGGAAVAFFVVKERWDVKGQFHMHSGAEALGLSFDQADALFYPVWNDRFDFPVPYENISAAWGARVIRYMIATGDIDWPGQCNPEDVA